MLAKTFTLSSWVTGCRKSGLPDFQRPERTGPAPPGPEKVQCARQNREKTCLFRQAGKRTDGADSQNDYQVFGKPVAGGLAVLPVVWPKKRCCVRDKTGIRKVLFSCRTARGTGSPHTPPAENFSPWSAGRSEAEFSRTRGKILGQPPDRAYGLGHQKPGPETNAFATKKRKTRSGKERFRKTADRTKRTHDTLYYYWKSKM